MSASKKKILSSEQLRFLDIAFHGTFSDEASLQKDWSDDMYERLVKATRRCKAVVQEWLEVSACSRNNYTKINKPSLFFHQKERKAEYAQELKKTAATTSIAATTDVRVIEETPRKVVSGRMIIKHFYIKVKRHFFTRLLKTDGLVAHLTKKSPSL